MDDPIYLFGKAQFDNGFTLGFIVGITAGILITVTLAQK